MPQKVPSTLIKVGLFDEIKFGNGLQVLGFSRWSCSIFEKKKAHSDRVLLTPIRTGCGGLPLPVMSSTAS